MVRKVDMRKQVRAMNTVQNTKLGIDPDMLEAVEYVIEQEMDTAESSAIRQLPTLNDEADWQDTEKRREINRMRSHVHAHNNKAHGKRLSMFLTPQVQCVFLYRVSHWLHARGWARGA